jgi:adenylyltransferase/sulfurtransferase
MPLADEQIDRYSRQILLREIGARGQERLMASSAVIIGSGSLAHLCALYLVGAGVGRIGLVAPSGSTSDAPAEDLAALNPEVRIEPLSLPFPLAPHTSPLAPLSTFDVLVDTGTAASTSIELAKLVATTKRPLLGAAVRGSQGWVARHGGSDGCVVCLAPHAADARPEGPDTEPSPVGVVASLLAFEVLATLLGWEERESWSRYDGTTLSLETGRFNAHPACSACVGRRVGDQ